VVRGRTLVTLRRKPRLVPRLGREALAHGPSSPPLLYYRQFPPRFKSWPLNRYSPLLLKRGYSDYFQMCGPKCGANPTSGSEYV
jgi:hypothetical protein